MATINDAQLQILANYGDALANRLSMGESYMDGTVVAGLVLAVRALRTKLEPPAPVETPAAPPTPAAEPAGETP